MEKFRHDEEMIPTMYVDRGGTAYRINVADYDGKEPVHPASHNVPPGAALASTGDDGGDTGKPAKGKGGGKANDPAPTVDNTPYVVGPDADGKFWRTDKTGANKLIDTPFASQAEAAAAVIPT